MTHPLSSPTFSHFVDSTMVSSFRSCPRKWFYEFCLHLQPIGTRWDLHAGAAFARGAEAVRLAFLAGATFEEAISSGISALTLYYGPDDPPPESKKGAKAWLNLISALRGYFAHFGLETDSCSIYNKDPQIPGVEYSFAIPMEHCQHPETSDPLLYVGRFDALVHRGPLLFWLDDKTTGSLGADWATKWNLRGQFLGYTWALRQHEWSNGLVVAGGIVRGIGLYANGCDFLQRDLYFQQSLVEEWKEDLEETLQQMAEHFTNYTNFDIVPPRVWNDTCTSYGGCPFLEICRQRQLPAELPSEFVVHEWHPIELEPIAWEPPQVPHTTELVP